MLRMVKGRSTGLAPELGAVFLAMGLKSRGSLHKHIQGLIEAGLVEAPNRKQRGIRLTEKAFSSFQAEEIHSQAPRQFSDSNCNSTAYAKRVYFTICRKIKWVIQS